MIIAYDDVAYIDNELHAYYCTAVSAAAFWLIAVLQLTAIHYLKAGDLGL